MSFIPHVNLPHLFRLAVIVCYFDHGIIYLPYPIRRSELMPIVISSTHQHRHHLHVLIMASMSGGHSRLVMSPFLAYFRLSNNQTAELISVRHRPVPPLSTTSPSSGLWFEASPNRSSRNANALQRRCPRRWLVNWSRRLSSCSVMFSPVSSRLTQIISTMVPSPASVRRTRRAMSAPDRQEHVSSASKNMILAPIKRHCPSVTGQVPLPIKVSKVPGSPGCPAALPERPRRFTKALTVAEAISTFHFPSHLWLAPFNASLELLRKFVMIASSRASRSLFTACVFTLSASLAQRAQQPSTTVAHNVLRFNSGFRP